VLRLVGAVASSNRSRSIRAANLGFRWGAEPQRGSAGKTTIMKVTRLKIWLLSDRGYPEGVVTLPEDVVRDFSDLLARAQAVTPGVSLHSVVQAIWTLGSRRLGDNIRHHIPVRAAMSPEGMTPLRVRSGVGGPRAAIPVVGAARATVRKGPQSRLSNKRG
jgi:hypothetical protein